MTSKTIPLAVVDLAGERDRQRLAIRLGRKPAAQQPGGRAQRSAEIAPAAARDGRQHGADENDPERARIEQRSEIG